MNRSTMIWASSAFVALLGVVPLASAQATSQVLQYNVEHPTYGNIGTYTNIVSENGTSTDVHTVLHIAVKVIGIPLFHQDATREERWENQRLVGFQSATDDNGTKIDVTGEAEASRFVIHSSSNGTISAPPQVHPSNPWAPFILKTNVMMSSKTGKVLPVVVTDTGEVTVTLDGRPVRARQWFIDDNKHQVVWIDDKGVVVAFQAQEHGTAIKFVLTHATAAAQPAVPTPLANN